MDEWRKVVKVSKVVALGAGVVGIAILPPMWAAMLAGLGTAVAIAPDGKKLSRKPPRRS